MLRVIVRTLDNKLFLYQDDNIEYNNKKIEFLAKQYGMQNLLYTDIKTEDQGLIKVLEMHYKQGTKIDKRTMDLIDQKGWAI